MTKRKVQPFPLGNILLDNNIFYAPLAGCTDYPFRKIAKTFSPGLVYCEMVKMEALVRHDINTYHLLDYDETMHPIGAQICGSNPNIASSAAKIIEDLGFDVIDLNCGCPVDKVTKDGSGSAMLKTPNLIGDIISEIKSSVNIPVTVKIRSGWDENNICVESVTAIAEEAGAGVITVHGRTRKQGYRGCVNRDYIKAAKSAAKKIKVMGNGDILSPEDAFTMMEETGADGVVIGRGALSQPWIAQDIFNHGKNNTPVKSREYVLQVMQQHFQYIMEYNVEKKALLDMRRVGFWYMKKCDRAKDIRIKLNSASSTKEVMLMLERALYDVAS
jgi:tRNA-dihydrouridine synthase B